MPFAELKHVVEGMADEASSINIQYPDGDAMLLIQIPEELSKDTSRRAAVMETTLQLETY